MAFETLVEFIIEWNYHFCRCFVGKEKARKKYTVSMQTTFMFGYLTVCISKTSNVHQIESKMKYD